MNQPVGDNSSVHTPQISENQKGTYLMEMYLPDEISSVYQVDTGYTGILPNSETQVKQQLISDPFTPQLIHATIITVIQKCYFIFR